MLCINTQERIFPGLKTDFDPIDPLRTFLTYRYTHEIRVNLHRLEQVPYPLEASPVEGASAGASEGGAGSGGGKRRRE